MPLPPFVCRWLFATLVAAGVAGPGLAGAPANPPVFSTTVFSVDAGLPSNVAQALWQTRDGYLWIGTEAGLARFDGVRFTVFRAGGNAGPPDNLIRCFFEDRDGVLWIGTQTGFCAYRDGRFERVRALSAPVASIAQDQSGALWIGTQGAGVWEFRDGRLTQRADGRLLQPTDSPMRLFVDSRDRIWAAVNHGPLLVREAGTWRVPPAPVAGFRQVNRFAEHPKGTLWFAAERELYRVRGDEVRRFGVNAGVGEEQLTDLLFDAEGRFWVAGHALWMAEDPEKDDFRRISLPEVEYPRFLIQDREGTYWLGTSGDGLARVRPSAFRMVNFADNRPLVRARSVTADASGTVWGAFGTDPRGVARVAPDGTISFLPVGKGAEGESTAVMATRDGRLWIGTRGALKVWHDGVLERFPEYQQTRLLFESRDGTLWIGLAFHGVVRWKDGRFERLAVPRGYENFTPAAMTDGEPGVVYIGYNSGGILRVDANGASPYDGGAPLPSPEIRALHRDANGRMWVGFRRDGLGVLLDGAWRNPDALIQPFAERVAAIDEDDRGNLWVGTVRGVFWGTRADFLAVARGESAEGRFRAATVSDGIGGGVVGVGTQPAMCKAPNGTLWFATRGGLLAADPAQMRLNRMPPPVHVESVSVDGRSVPAHGELHLPAGARSVTIDYTALSFVQPNRVLFRYRLAGHDRGWIQAGTRRTAFYTRLEPGRYQFQVIACNEDGIWNQTGATLTFVQAPWFYQTWWFYGLVAAAVLSTGFALFYWRTAGLRRLVAQQTEQIRLQLEKEAHLNAELERKARLESLGVLAGGIAHDFNNLLTVIISNLGLARLDPRVQAAAGDLLAAAERGAERASDLTQQLLTFAKGGDPVRRAVALPDVVREAADFARHGTPVRCDVTVEPNLPAANVDRAQISRVIHNLVLNATQAMPHGGVIELTLARANVGTAELPGVPPGPYIKLSIRDRGSGIAPEHLAHVFEPYFSTKPRSHGLGLATVHSIVKKHQGHIGVESVVGQGTTFHVWLPVATDYAEPVPAVAAAAPKLDRRLRVLFMDDEEIIRTVAEGILRHLGHDAAVVGDGADAVRVYREALEQGRRFDVVVLDLTVPGGMGGRAAIDALRQLDPNVRAIVSSGYSSDPVLANFRDFGFSAVVPKPYQLEVLAQAIVQVAGSVPAAR